MARSRKKTGSPSGGPLYLSVGFLRRPHGIHGEIIMDLHTDFPERMQKGRKVYIGDEYKPAAIEGIRRHGNGVLIKLPGVNTPEAAGSYRNQWVYVRERDVPALPEGRYYKHDLFGLRVVDEKDTLLGELTEIIETGANDVYVVRNESGAEILLPAIPTVVLDLRPDLGFIRVHLLDGLINT